MRFTIKPEKGRSVVLADKNCGNEVGWWLTAIDGWLGTPSPREKAREAEGRTGDFWPAKITQGARTVTLEGVACCESSEEAARAVSTVNALAGQRLVVGCESALPYQEVEGFLSDDPACSLYAGECDVSFTLIISCPYPVKRGRGCVFRRIGPGGIRVSNEGNAPSWPRVKATGNLTYMTLKQGSGEVSWSGNAKELCIDFFDMVPSTGTVTVDKAFPIEPGISEVSVSCNAGAAVEFEVAPAWR